MKENTGDFILFERLVNGSHNAFEQIYRLYFPRLYAFSFKITQDSAIAKDVVQNVFVKVWEMRKNFSTESPEAFIFKMVRNASLNYIRNLKVVDKLKTEIKNQYLGELYHIDLVGDEPYILIEQELNEKIQEIMNSLPPKCQAVFRMSRIDGLKNREIAEKLDISIKAVEKHIAKAMQVYKHQFSDYLPLHIIILVLAAMK